MGPIGPILNFCSLGFYYVYILGSGSILSPIDIFKFLLRKREWVKLYIILATQLIKAQAQQEDTGKPIQLDCLLTKIQS